MSTPPRRFPIRALLVVLALGAGAVLFLLWHTQGSARPAPALVRPGATEQSTESLAELEQAEPDARESRSALQVATPDEIEEALARSDRGDLHVLTESAFLARLGSLGVRGGTGAFERIHGQKAELGAVFVLVTDGENNVVPGARVFLDPATPEALASHVGSGSYSDAVRSATSDASGVALFSNVDPIEHLLAVEHTSYLTRFFGTLLPVAGERTFVEAELEKAVDTIAGTVRTENGTPLSGVMVSASHYTEGGVPFVSTMLTQNDGRFELGVVTGSENVVVARKFGFAEARLEHVRAGTKDQRITMEPADTVRVSGFVTKGTSMDPVTAFRVDGKPFQDAGGRFQVERNVQAAPQVLLFEAPGYDSRTVSVTLDTPRDLDLGQVSLFGKRELNGIVLLDDGDGNLAPIEAANVSVASDTGWSASQVTAADGLFSFRDVVAEEVTLSASAAGTGRYQSQVQLQGDAPTYVEVRLSPGTWRAAGRVLDDETGDPIEGAGVEVVERPYLTALTDASGSFELTGIPIQSFSLRASHSGYSDATSPMLDAGDGEASWEARLKASGLRFRLLAAGAPVPAGVRVTLWKRIQPTLAAALAAQQSIDSYRFFAQTDAKGEVTFDVEDGDWYVQVEAYRLDPMLVRANSQAAQWITLDLPGVTRLDGTIRYADGSPVASTSLWLHSGDQDYSTMSLFHTDALGNYRIPNLGPHPYALSIVKSVADQSAQHVIEFVGSGASTQRFDVTFPPLTSSIHGRLTDENGVGKPGVWIGVEYLDAPHRSILAGWVGTDAAGNFLVPRLEPGRHIVRTAWTAEETVFSDIVTLAAGEDREVNLVAPNVPGLHITGTMIASDGGPLGGNFVFATDADGHQNGNYFSRMDWGYTGSFDCGGLRPSTYQLTLTAMGCMKQTRTVGLASSVNGLVIPMVREGTN